MRRAGNGWDYNRSPLLEHLPAIDMGSGEAAELICPVRNSALTRQSYLNVDLPLVSKIDGDEASVRHSAKW